MTELLGCTNDNNENCEIYQQQTFTDDWFSHNVPNWSKHKSLFFDKENMRCLEIGSYQGRSAIYTVENFCNGKNSYVDSVDTWEGSIEHTDQQKNSLYDIFINNTKKYIDQGKIIPHQMFSSEFLLQAVQDFRANKIESYDFIYIDASHTAKDVLMDAVLAWELLKVGGVMIFDDYKWDKFQDNSPMHPKPAIDGFLNSFAGMYQLLHKDYQVHIKKIADNPDSK